MANAIAVGTKVTDGTRKGEVTGEVEDGRVAVKWDECRFCGRTLTQHESGIPFAHTYSIESTLHLGMVNE